MALDISDFESVPCSLERTALSLSGTSCSNSKLVRWKPLFSCCYGYFLVLDSFEVCPSNKPFNSSGPLISNLSNTQLLVLTFLLFACWCFWLLLQKHFPVLYILSISEFRQSPCHLGSVNPCTHLGPSIQWAKPIDCAWLLNQYERRIQHCLLSPFAACVCTVPACTAEAERLCQVLHRSMYKTFTSSPADKGLTPPSVLQQEEDLEEIAVSFLSHTQMLNINTGSSVKSFFLLPIGWEKYLEVVVWVSLCRSGV